MSFFEESGRIISVVRKRLWLVCLLTILCTSVSLVAAMYMKRIYASTASVLLESTGASGIGINGGLFGSTLMNFGSTQSSNMSPDYIMQIMKSDVLSLRVIEKLHLSKNNEFAHPGENQEKLLIKFHELVAISSEPMLIKVTFQNEDPVIAARVANEIVEQTKLMLLESASEETIFYSSESRRIEKELDDIEQQIWSYNDKNGVVALDQQVVNFLNSESAIQNDILKKSSELESLLKIRENTTDLTLWTQSSQQIEALKQEIRLLTSEKNKANQSLATLPKIQYDYLKLLRNQRIYTERAASIQSQVVTAQFNLKSLNRKFSLLDRAQPSQWPIKPKRKLIVITGFLIGLLLSIIIALIADMKKSSSELKESI